MAKKKGNFSEVAKYDDLHVKEKIQKSSCDSYLVFQTPLLVTEA